MISRVLMTAGLLSAQAADSQYDKYMKNYAGGSQSGSQSGNYQKYMKEYAGGQGGDYQQYMKKYAGGQGGNYQQYMKKYAGGQGGDYQQYMKKYSGGQGGNYQQYMQKYSKGGDYQQYMDKYDASQSSDDLSATSGSLDTLNLAAKDATATDSQGNYQQYMQKYAGGKGGNYKQYMDKYAGSYEKYFDKYTKNNGGAQGGDYQQYMKKYAGGQGGDYQQYMKKYTGGQGGDYQQYMQKYTGGSQDAAATSSTELIEQPPMKTSDSTDTLNLAATDATATGGQGGQQNYQKYMDKYAGSYEKYMKQYAGDYQKYQNYQNKACDSVGNIQSAKDAKTKEELDAWYTKAQEQVKCFVPNDYSTYATKDIDKAYKAHLAELEKDSQTPLTANDAAEELIEKPKMVEKTQSATKQFLAKAAASAGARTEKIIEQAEHKAKVAQSQVDANLALFADQVKSDPATVVGASLLGTAVACVVFFAVRYRRSVQLPVDTLLG